MDTSSRTQESYTQVVKLDSLTLVILVFAWKFIGDTRDWVLLIMPSHIYGPIIASRRGYGEVYVSMITGGSRLC
jgi:hypothetical protein